MSDRAFTSPMLTTELDSLGGSLCRVCKLPVAHGARVRHRAWSVEVAHVECGWFAPGSTTEPHEVRRPGSFSAFWEWQCPKCKLDACDAYAPLPLDPRECARCLKRPPLGVGVVARSLIASVFPIPIVETRRMRGTPRRIHVPSKTRCLILNMHDEAAYVHWAGFTAAERVWCRTAILSPLFVALTESATPIERTK